MPLSLSYSFWASGLRAGGRCDSPLVGVGLHFLVELGVVGDHALTEGFDVRVRRLLFGELAELDLVVAALRGVGEELLVAIGGLRLRCMGEHHCR